MRSIYFFLPDYPIWTTGGHKYHTILFEYFKKKRSDVYSFGNNRFSKKIETNNFLKILYGMFYILKIPKRSIIVQSNTSFLYCYIPLLFNKLWKNHFYFLIIHHLVRDEKQSYLRMKLEDYFIRKADKVITVSCTTQQKLYQLNLGLNNIEVFNPGLDVSIKFLNYKKTFPPKFKLLFVGTIEERKGLIYLVEAIKLLKMNNIELNIIGEQSNSRSYYNLLINKIRELDLTDKIFFRGKVSKEELENYYINSSIFVFPSLWEGYGMVVSEAMAYGLPIVASNIPAIEELINDGISGLLVEPKNANQISEKIKMLLSDHFLMNSISQNSFKKAQSFLSWEKTSHEIFNVILKNLKHVN